MSEEEKKEAKVAAPKRPPIATPNDDAKNVIKGSDETPVVKVDMER